MSRKLDFGAWNHPTKYEILQKKHDRFTADKEKLRKALEGLLTFDRVERPVFRSKPLGAQNSTARIFQDTLIAIEDAAAQALADTE